MPGVTLFRNCGSPDRPRTPQGKLQDTSDGLTGLAELARRQAHSPHHQVPTTRHSQVECKGGAAPPHLKPTMPYAYTGNVARPCLRRPRSPSPNPDVTPDVPPVHALLYNIHLSSCECKSSPSSPSWVPARSPGPRTWTAFRVERRQFTGVGSDDVTPDMLAQLDFSDKSTRTYLILAVTIACLALITVAVSVRLLVRRIMTRQFFQDDGELVNFLGRHQAPPAFVPTSLSLSPSHQPSSSPPLCLLQAFASCVSWVSNDHATSSAL